MNLMSMIEVFKTNVQEKTDAGRLVDLLKEQFPCSRINFDLWDCDNILRVEGHDFETYRIIEIVKASGFSCSVLES
jgi:hypothetical protein